MYTRLPASDPRAVQLAAGKPQLVVFFAYWSGPSQSMTPLLLGLETEYSGRVVFTYLDIDDPGTRPLQRSLGFRQEPHLFLLDATGKIIRQWSGSVSLEELRQALNEAATP
jgi:thioredoxin-like negative regulator of GroEL